MSTRLTPPNSLELLAPAGMRRRLTRSRQRLAQAYALSQVVTRRLEGSEDLELQKLGAVAQITQGMALFVLGHPRTAARSLKRTTTGEDPAMIQAWQQIAAMLASGSDRLGKIGAASALSLRADALGAGDRHIARIAYDDSLHDRAITDRSMIVKLIARALRPRPKAERRR